MKKLFEGLFFCIMAMNLYANEASTQPEENVIFSITCNIAQKNHSNKMQFDLAMLSTFKQQKIVTSTPWTKGKTTFEGPLVKDILDYVGASGTEILATALNGYQIVLPIKDVMDYPVILALKQNGKLLSIRKRGPNWVIYPWDENEELNAGRFYLRAIWQLKEMTIR